MENLLALLLFLFCVDVFAGVNGTRINGIETQKKLDAQLLLDIRFGSFKDIKRSISEGAYVNAHNIRLNPVLYYAIDRPDSLEVVEFLLKKGAKPNFRNFLGDTSLHGAARFNKDPKVHQALLNYGANVNARDNAGNTPLHGATHLKNSFSVLITLLQNGADPDIRNTRGQTTLEVAESVQNYVAIYALKVYSCSISFQ